ncbi:MAG: trmB [Parachlamydiales bacterium]|nr:trmB [Parachlamydiales bacterium]
MKQASDLYIPFEWERRRPILLEKCLYVPDHYDGHDQLAIDWNDPAVFEKKQPLVVEYCSGNGQWIAMMAKQNPLLNWVAVEMDFERARKIWLKIFRQNLPNLFVVYGEGLTFSRHYLPDKSVHEAYVNFPDPWPKRRHAKHRLISDAFVSEMDRILQPGSSAILTTDDAAYSDWIIRRFSQWQSAFAPMQYTTEWPSFGDSYFYSLWLGQQRTIRFHRFISKKVRGEVRGRGI